jgi:solute carrier family 26 protein
MAIIMSTVAMTLLAVNNEHLKPRLAKKCKIPVPIELIVVLAGNAASYLFDLNKSFDLSVIGKNQLTQISNQYISICIILFCFYY